MFSYPQQSQSQHLLCQHRQQRVRDQNHSRDAWQDQKPQTDPFVLPQGLCDKIHLKLWQLKNQHIGG